MNVRFSGALLAAAAVSGVAACRGSAGAEAPPGGRAGSATQVVPVEVTAAWVDTVVDAIAATGQIEAMQSIELRPEVEGRLVEILVREGTEVRQGQALFKVDDGELRAQVARAEADRDLARQALERTRRLFDEHATSPAEMERAEAQARSFQASYELLSLRLERTVVRAPFTGVAGARLVSLGDYLTNGSRLIALSTVNPQRAAFQVPERYADRLAVGQTVHFTVAALTRREFEGRVDFVDPTVQLPGRTITVKALVANPRRELQAGMFIEARLSTETRPGAIVVPEEAILSIQGGTFVWVVSGDKVSRRRVVLGVRTPGYVEIRDGLDAGEPVVVNGLDRLVDGGSVQATPIERRPHRPSETFPE